MVRILCLHGFAQHPSEISTKTLQIQKALPECEFIFPCAAIKLVSFDGDIEDRGRKSEASTARFAWNYPDDNMSTNLIDLEATLRCLKPVLELQGPFDGIMGFSQGAAVASAVASILSRNSEIRHPVMKFAVLFCGARPAHITFDDIYQHITTPSLHLIGKQDIMVPTTRSLELAQAFERPMVVCHPGNHFIPQGWTYTQSVKRFVLQHTKPQADLPASTTLPDPSLAEQVPSENVPRPDELKQLTRSGSHKVRLIRKRSLVRVSQVCCK